MLDLLLLRHNLLVKKINLLRGYGVVCGLGLFSWRGCLSANVVERFFAVCAELWVLELPCLCNLCETLDPVDFRMGGGLPTFCPYGDWPFSSLFCRTLWKSYLFSWRTKLAKLLCLKCFGRMVLVNFSHYGDSS